VLGSPVGDKAGRDGADEANGPERHCHVLRRDGIVIAKTFDQDWVKVDDEQGCGEELVVVHVNI